MIRKAGFVAFLAFVAYLVFYLYFFFGFHLRYFNHKPGICRHVKGLNFGSENFKTISTGQVFITSGVSSAAVPPAYQKFIRENGMSKGRIFLYDFNQPSVGAVSLKILPSSNFNLSNFHPHGIDVLENKVNEEHLLYVVSHRNDHTEAVEKFRFDPKSKTLQYVKTFKHELFTTLNDVAVISEDKFYASNYMHFQNFFGAMLEHLAPLSIGNLVFVDGNKVNTVIPGLNGPNGITLSEDRKLLYIAEFFDRAVSVWSSKIPGVLDLVQRVSVHTSSPDNLHLSPEGTELFIGAHPIYHQFFAYLLDPAKLAPSSVLRLPLRDGVILEDKIEEIFYDDGTFKTASTIANVYKGQLLIGSLLNKLTICNMNK